MSTADFIANPLTKLNVGCGFSHKKPEEGWLNLDRVAFPGVWQHDLDNDVYQGEVDLAMWDKYSGKIEEFYMSHVLEHCQFPLLVMTKLWKLAKHGALCTIKVPYGSSDNAWEDPTHTRPYFIGSFQYFSQAAYHLADYGYEADWKIMSRTLHMPAHEAIMNMDTEDIMQYVNSVRNTVIEMEVVLMAQKPIRKRGDWREASPITFNFRKQS